MGFYFSIFGLLAFFAFIELSGLRKRDDTILFIVFSMLFFLLSFIRWERGTDWSAYYNYFNSITGWFQESEFEPGFAFLNEFVKLTFDNYTVLLLILGMILFSFQSAAIFKLSPYPVISLLFLWSVSFGNVMFVRQSISTVILLWSVTYIRDRRFWKFLSMVALAMLFHRTSIIFILAWWIYKLKWKPITLIIWVLGSVALSAILAKLLESIGVIAGGIVQSKIDAYMGNSEATFGTNSSISEIIFRGFANKIVIFAASLLMLDRIKDKFIEFRGYLNLYWAGIILYFSTISISLAMVRLSYAFDIFQIIIIPILLSCIESRYWRAVAYVLSLFYLALRLYISLTANYYEVFVPFKTIFEQ